MTDCNSDDDNIDDDIGVIITVKVERQTRKGLLVRYKNRLPKWVSRSWLLNLSPSAKIEDGQSLDLVMLKKYVPFEFAELRIAR
jgi:hypothetical protein